MKNFLLPLISIPLFTGCVSIADLEPLSYVETRQYSNTSDQYIYDAAVHCALGSFSPPGNKIKLFSYKNEDHFKYSLWFVGHAQSFDDYKKYKGSLTFKVKDSKAEFKFNNFYRYVDDSEYQDSDWSIIYEGYDYLNVKRKTSAHTEEFFACIRDNT